jgi:hypothetical protein
MKEINIPLPDFLDKQIAEIEVKINGKKRHYNFKVESFRWENDDEQLSIDNKIKNLQVELKKYERSWELIQIFRPKDDSKFIQVLFRQKEIVNPN